MRGELSHRCDSVMLRHHNAHDGSGGVGTPEAMWDRTSVAIDSAGVPELLPRSSGGHSEQREPHTAAKCRWRTRREDEAAKRQTVLNGLLEKFKYKE